MRGTSDRLARSRLITGGWIVAALLVAGGAPGCFSPALAPCALSCETDTDCPAGLACEGNRCGACGDAAVALVIDARVTDASTEQCAALTLADGCAVHVCGRCFVVCSGVVSRDEAGEVCAAMGGQLAQPRVLPQRECLGLLLTSPGWVDLNQADGEQVDGGWTWASGDVFTGPWSQGEPNDGDANDPPLEAGRQQCGALLLSGNAIDLSCTVGQAQTICQPD